jgi:hypothetical protein
MFARMLNKLNASRSTRYAVLLATWMLLLAGLIGSPALPVAQADTSPLTFPPTGEWTAKWWQWALSIPADQNPLFDPPGAQCTANQSGPVFFLGGTFGGSAERWCTMPSGKAILFPILNYLDGSAVFDCEPTAPGPCVISDLRAIAASQMDNPQLLAASIDGVALTHLQDYRVTSPVFHATLPEGAIFGIPAGTYWPQVSDGYWVMVAPLSPGAHTLHLHGITRDGFETEVLYHLTIQ